MSEKKIAGVHELGIEQGMYEMFSSKGTMTPVKKYRLDRGVHLICLGYAMNRQDFVTIDSEHAVELATDETKDWTREPDLKEDEGLLGGYFNHRHYIQKVKPISEKFGIGVYFAEDEELVSEEVIIRSIQRAEFLDKLEQLKKEDDERKDRENYEMCIHNYKYLKRIDSMRDSKEMRLVVNSNIRAELKKHFPSTKFSINYKSFAGGCSYYVEWNDGPTVKDVDKVVKKFQYGQPDEYSQGDYWDEVPTNFTNLYGGAKYVLTQRRLTEDVIEIAKLRLLNQIPDLTDENVSKKAMPFSCSLTLRSVRDAARAYAYQLDFQSLSDIGNDMKKENVPTGTFEIVEYSEKAIVLTGDTKSIKDTLKNLGGRFNPKLSCGAGWVFPKNKESDLRLAIGM